MPKLHFVKAARKDNPKAGIKKGESYYWWQFAFSPKQYSKTRPDRTQLTRSEFYKALWPIEDRIGDCRSEFNEPGDVENFIEEIKTELEQLRDEQEEKKSNMPDALQESDSGQLLQDRYDKLDEAISELENIDLIYEEDEGDTEEEALTRLEEWLDEKAEEIQNISLE